MDSPNYDQKLVGGSLLGSSGTVAVTPEPSAAVLLLSGHSLAGLAFLLHGRTTFIAPLQV